MKGILFFLLLSIALPAQAQVELGFNIGMAINTKPDGNLFYEGDKSPVSPAASLKAMYNLDDVWQAGLDISLSQLKRKSDKEYDYHLGGTIGGDDKSFVLAKTYTSVCGLFNGKIAHRNGYFYGGVAAGYGVARHNSGKLTGNESYRAPDGGHGLVAGIQLGWVSGITSKLGWNVEASARRMDLKYDATAPKMNPPSELHYNLYHVMLTVGLRYRLSNTIQDREQQIQDAMNIGS